MQITKNLDQIISLKAEENSCLIGFAMKLHKQYTDTNMLLLSHKESSFVEDSLRELKDGMDDFDKIYPSVRFMFLKESWSILDKMYGKTFFINEIQKIMKDKDYTTHYFHRIDTLFDGCIKRDIERIISDIIEVARYYHKKVLFSFNDKTRLGHVIDEVMNDKIDLEFLIEKDSYGVCQREIQKYKKQQTSILLYSDKKELIDFHHYIFKEDEFINFQQVLELDEKNYNLVDDTDIIIFNLQNISLKNELLAYVKNQNLKTKFLFLSDVKAVRKRDKLSENENGISYMYGKQFNLLEYIYSLEKVIGRDFYTSALKKIDITTHVKYYEDFEEFKSVTDTFEKHRICCSVVSVNYQYKTTLTKATLEKCIRDLDMVYHDTESRRLLFVLVDVLPRQAFLLICDRLKELDIKHQPEHIFDTWRYISSMQKREEQKALL